MARFIRVLVQCDGGAVKTLSPLSTASAVIWLGGHAVHISFRRSQLHLPGLIYTKHGTVAVGYRHAKSMRSVNYFFLRYILHAASRLCMLVKASLDFSLVECILWITAGSVTGI